jgi:ABC-type transport system involved in multi-copper enzyme maturation permease subunit
MRETGNIAQVFALIVGVTYLLVGLVGFAVTGFTGVVTDGADKLIGFDLNIFHNVVHLVIGLVLLVVSRLPDASIAQGVLIGGGLVYILAAGLGFLNELQILSIDSELAPDNFLHLFSGIAAVAAGIIGANQSSARMAPA